MKKLGILNTSIISENIGDSIIMDGALHELGAIISNSLVVQFPTHEKLSMKSYRIQRNLDFNIACGTNLLHSHMGIIKQWNIGFIDAFALQPIVLMGVGWRSQAKRIPDFYTKWLLKKILSKKYFHSVRDSYAENQLKYCGVENVINTGCHTLWSLTEEHCRTIPTVKGKSAVITLTDYSRNPELDKKLINTVIDEYKDCYFWCQGFNDMEYIRDLDFNNKLTLIPTNLKAYDDLLTDESLSLDYIGTRLHGGIRALQKSRRTLIVGIDHRANVMGADFNLPVIDRYTSNDNFLSLIKGDRNTSIALPVQNIEKWKEQFLV